LTHTTEEAPERLRLAETGSYEVLQLNPPNQFAVMGSRTSRIALVMELPYDMHNVLAVLRTAECFGIQYIYIVRNEYAKNQEGGTMISKVWAIHYFREAKYSIPLPGK